MDNQSHNHTPIWAYPSAILLLAVLTFVQMHYFSASTTTLGQLHVPHSCS